MIYRLNIGLLVLLGAILVMLMVLRVDNSRPNYQVNLGDDMTYSPAFTPFEANSNFANGRTLQDPVPGTIARGTQLFSFEATPEGALRAGTELPNPFDPSSEAGIASADRGDALFSVFCISCHGADGTGNGPVAKWGFPPPPSLLTGKSREMKDGQLFHILTYGQNSMPQFAAQLPPASRWDLINYIRRIQNESPPITTESSVYSNPSGKIEAPLAISANTEAQP
ncbi:c-type cytochrome [Bythopirellula polymerisocia]|uniref:Cytochrome c n=1 Tax=Bythopirellula polymerisocia TaxID=2528003 RepID=A0A5C6CGD0_9BACT|nr:cytochrome c [Bythopirellula polymerisocia]TWU21789.1 Cytochrome c [Bythopirellula polymerisocia]